MAKKKDKDVTAPPAKAKAPRAANPAQRARNTTSNGIRPAPKPPQKKRGGGK